MSSETRPIKVTNLDSEKIRANEIAIENSKTGKVTAVVIGEQKRKIKAFGEDLPKCSIARRSSKRSRQSQSDWDK